MRLLKLLNEEISLNNIKKECKYYINLVKKNNTKNKFLYRGIILPPQSFKKMKVRKNRKPMNMDKVLHDHFNKLFKKRFGKNLRSETLFVTSDYDLANDYGNTIIVLPIGKFDYYYNKKIYDLFEDLSFITTNYKKDPSKYEEEIKSVVKDYKKNTDFKYMMDLFSGEIMIDCNYYYGINANTNEKLFKLFL